MQASPRGRSPGRGMPLRRRCMPQPEHLAGPDLADPGLAGPDLTSTGQLAGTSSWVPDVPGVLSADQLIATGRAIAASQQADGSIGWPDGHVDAWNQDRKSVV